MNIYRFAFYATAIVYILYFSYKRFGSNFDASQIQCNAEKNIWDVQSDTCLQVTYGLTKEEFGIEVLGSTQFVEQVTKAIYLLKYKSYDNFLYVKEYIGKIQQIPESGLHGMLAYKNPPTYNARNSTVFFSLTWCAASLVHEAHHSFLYHSYKKHYPGKKVPYVVWGEQNAELQCITKQISAMHDIGSPQSDILYTSQQNGKHGDLDGDGKYNTPNDKRLQAEANYKRYGKQIDDL